MSVLDLLLVLPGILVAVVVQDILLVLPEMLVVMNALLGLVALAGIGHLVCTRDTVSNGCPIGNQ